MREFFDFGTRPGHLYVVATLLPLASFLLLLLVAAKRSYLRRARGTGTFSEQVYRMLGGDAPGRGGAYVATAAIGLSFVLCLMGFVQFTSDQHHVEHLKEDVKAAEARLSEPNLSAAERKARAEALTKLKEEARGAERGFAHRWADQVAIASLSFAKEDPKNPERFGKETNADPGSGTALYVGYYIDNLSAVMFLMVTLIATLIHVFSIGYMKEELDPEVVDHEVHADHGHLHRRGRFPRFFMFLSLFCFSMLNLILANNLFQVFISWELVGICSYLLIGFYFERQTASDAANKAFITNRVGDAGFIIGLMILWAYVGTFNFQELFSRVRSPERDFHGKMEYGGQFVRANPADISEEAREKDRQKGRQQLAVIPPADPVSAETQLLIFPRDTSGHFHGVGPGGDEEVTARDSPRADQYAAMPYWLFVVAGLGLFLGCVGKSAQFPLHVWLPDAMEGPTPVSALIHAATMVAAGVYLVGRCFPLFTPEVLLVIGYTGAITLFVAATIALVMTDIKKVLAYSTVSQLGYMMLGLAVGGWAAGLFHLVTHAFFKALLFLCSGAVIYNCHHVQDINRMGGLFPKMKITALTMLVGVLAIAGTPLFSGWYSKDAVLASALGFAIVHNGHLLLFILPLIGAGLTAFYMFRMWFLTFTGKPRDHHVYEHAHESPWVMTVPLMVLAFFSVCVAWGWPLWDAEQSVLEHYIKHAEPPAVEADFGALTALGGGVTGSVVSMTKGYHHTAGNLALLVAFAGAAFAWVIYHRRALDPHEAREQFHAVYRALWNKWYFDELYSAVVVRPTLVVATWARWFDLNVIDGILHVTARFVRWLSWVGGLIDLRIVDGLVNVTANVLHGLGARLRNLQTGYIRSYVLFLALAAVAIWVILWLTLATPAAPR